MKISLAELEYSLEKDQIEMLNLAQSVVVRQTGCLYTAVQAGQVCLLAALSVEREEVAGLETARPHQACGLQVGHQGPGARLQPGDRVIEINGENVLKITSSTWPSLLAGLRSPVKVVVLRSVPASPGQQADHVTGLKEDIALIQTRLSEKLQEGRSVSLELSAVQQQRDKFRSLNDHVLPY